MSSLRLSVGSFDFKAVLEDEKAPETCRYFRSLLPYRCKLIHVRWSGEACWIPLGYEKAPIPFENLTSYPSPGQMLFYPGGYGETEILLAYGAVRFAGKVGQLAGNHFLTISEGLGQLPAMGKALLWDGALDVLISVEEDRA